MKIFSAGGGVAYPASLVDTSAWAVVHGLRYVALPCLLLFAASLFIRVRNANLSASMGWGDSRTAGYPNTSC